MLTDIFAYRYLKYPIWETYTGEVQRLLVQTLALAREVIPYYDSQGKEIEANKAVWKTVHDRLARELGRKELSPRYYSYTQKNYLGHEMPVSGAFTWDFMCEQFVTASPAGNESVDAFVKERLSFIELAMRAREAEIARINAEFPRKLGEAQARDSMSFSGPRIPGRASDAARAINTAINNNFANQVGELNERFRRADAPLSYHNGFIQVAVDQVIEKQISKPFWDLVSAPLWTNVDIDMKEALDRRDSNDKDPAIFAVKALESAIKIVSDEKKWTRGTEKGAADYINNLVSKKNGGFLAPWEGEMLIDYFRKVRNSLGHGPGSEPMPTLSTSQTDWAIETAMSWVRSLVRRM